MINNDGVYIWSDKIVNVLSITIKLPGYQFNNYSVIENYDSGIIKHKLNIYKWKQDKHKNKRQGSRVCDNIKVNNTVNCVQ